MAIDLSSLAQYRQRYLQEEAYRVLEIDGILAQKHRCRSRTCRTLGSHRFILAYGKLKEIVLEIFFICYKYSDHFLRYLKLLSNYVFIYFLFLLSFNTKRPANN